MHVHERMWLARFDWQPYRNIQRLAVVTVQATQQQQQQQQAAPEVKEAEEARAQRTLLEHPTKEHERHHAPPQQNLNLDTVK